MDKQAAYEINDQTSSAICQDIATLLDSIRAIQQKENMDAGEKEDRIKSLLPFALSRSDLSVLATTEDDSLSRLEQELNKSITVTMERGITQPILKRF